MSGLRLGVSSYSFWHFRGNKVPIADVLRKAREFGLDGVEILHRQMDSEDGDYLAGLKREALTQGQDLFGLSTIRTLFIPMWKSAQKTWRTPRDVSNWHIAWGFRPSG